jgi:hypothetical protein
MPIRIYQSIESNLELAKHAKRWEWKEVDSEDQSVAAQ